MKLATKLIKLGADVNLCPLENKFASEEGVPPLYYATAVRDAEIVKLLLYSGIDSFVYLNSNETYNSTQLF